MKARRGQKGQRPDAARSLQQLTHFMVDVGATPEPRQQRAASLTHFNADGAAHMVEVGAKPETLRTAIASGRIAMEPATADAVRAGTIGKGDVLGVARLAGIQAAKHAADLIPLCHPLRLTGIEIELEVGGAAVEIRATVNAFDRSGVEMEALAAVSAAALTIYDMCKAIDRAMAIGEIRLDEKRGGKSGTWVRSGDQTRKSRSAKKR